MRLFLLRSINCLFAITSYFKALASLALNTPPPFPPPPRHLHHPDKQEGDLGREGEGLREEFLELLQVSILIKNPFQVKTKTKASPLVKTFNMTKKTEIH